MPVPTPDEVRAAEARKSEADRETEEDIHKRIDFELALKRVQGDHVHFTDLSFKGCELTRKPEWMKMLCEALAANTTLVNLELSDCTLTDAAVQQLVITLCAASKCPKLKKLDLRGNPGVTVAGETMVQGLCKLRKEFEVQLGPDFDQNADTFACHKQLIENLSSWPAEVLKVPDGGNQDFYAPIEITGEGERVQLEKGFSGTNGVKFWCDQAEFCLFHNTGNMVLVKLKQQETLV